MVRILVLCVGLLGFVATESWGQCTPLSPSGFAGFSPQPDQTPCINRGEFYSEVFYLENLDTIFLSGIGQITVDTLIIDSIVNLPCNMQWIANEGDNRFYSTQTGCIRLYGTTNDSVGQYELKVYITAYLPILGRLTGELQQIIDDLETFIGNTGIDFKYYVRVKESGANCPNINPQGPAAISHRNCSIPGEFRVNETKLALLCAGDTTQLHTAPAGTVNPVFEWTPSGSVLDNTVSDPLVFPNARTWYTVTMTDSGGTGRTTYGRVLVQVNTQLPSAQFTKIQNNYAVNFEASDLVALSYLWNFGDGDTSTLRNIVHVYSAPGLYPVTLRVTNNCGSNTHTDTINVLSTTVKDLSNNLGMKIWPNPSKGRFVIEPAGIADSDVIHMGIYNFQGKLVYTDVVSSRSRSNVDLTQLGSGVYLMRMESEGRIIANQKIIITQ